MPDHRSDRTHEQELPLAPESRKLAPPSLLAKVAIRWPDLAVLRLHEVVLWVAIANFLAWGFARVMAPHRQAVAQTVAYMRGWLTISAVAALYWMVRQWRDRRALPVRRPMSIAWSPGASFLILAAILSPTFVSGWALDRHIRFLVDFDQISHDAENYDKPKFYLSDGWYRTLKPSNVWPYYPDKLSPDQEHLLVEYGGEMHLFKVKSCVNESIARHLDCSKRDAVLDIQIDRSVPVRESVRGAHETTEVLKRSASREALDRQCYAVIRLECGTLIDAFQDRVNRNVGYLANAHRIGYPAGFSHSEVPLHRIVFCVCVGLLGFVTTSLTMFRGVLVLGTVAAMAVIAASVRYVIIMLNPRIDWLPGRHIIPVIAEAQRLLSPVAIYLGCVGLFIFCLLLAALLVTHHKQRHRTNARDLMLLALLLWPFFTLLVQYAVDPFVLNIPDPGSYFYFIVFIVGLWTLLGVFPLNGLLNRYRRLPWAE